MSPLLEHGVTGLEGQLETRAGPSAAGPTYLIVMLPPVASCAATGAGAMRLASQRIAANRNPSRVIVSPSPATLLVNLDVPAADRFHGTVGGGAVVVRDGELVRAFARVTIVLDVGLETARIAIRAAHTLEMRVGAEYHHNVHRAIEVRVRDMGQVIQMTAVRCLLGAEAKTAYAARHAAHHIDLATASHRPAGG